MKERIYKPQHLRVLVITPSLAPGGAEQQIRTLIHHADRVTYSGIVTNPRAKEPWYPLSYNLLIIESEPEKGEGLADAIVRTVTENWGTVHADVIMHWGFGDIDLRHLPVPSIQIMHGSTVDFAHKQQNGWQKQLGKSKANYLVGVSASAAQSFDEESVAKIGKPIVIHNGVDIERVSVQRGEAEQRKIWGIPEDMKIMLYVGRLFLGKGPQHVIKALKHLPDDVGAVIYGWGDMLGELRALSAEFPGRVWFPQPKLDKLGDVYDVADVVVMPSDSEAFPLVMVEAWHAGCRLVCSEFHTIHELEEIHNCSLAYKIPCPPDEKDVADAVSLALSQDLGAQEMQAMAVARNHYSAGSMVFRWEEFFYHVANEWRKWGQIGGVERS